MCFSKYKYRKQTLKSIKKMNLALNTRFSYVYCIEEIDLLRLIPNKTETTNKNRLEHLSQVFGLWNKGIKEDFYAHNKDLRNYAKIKPLFDEFLANFIYELCNLNLISDYNTSFDYSINEDYYKIRFNEYDYETKKQKKDDIETLISVLQSFKLTLNKTAKPIFKEEIINTYLKASYYGPMSLYKGYNKVEKSISKYDFRSKANPFNYPANCSWSIRYSLLLRNRKNLLFESKKDYYKKQIDIELNRLEIELERLKKEDCRYDFYFDYFIWRLMFDLEYIFLKRLGGLKKVSELINIYYKGKEMSKGPIVVDVDRMTIVSNNKPSSNGGKASSKGQLNIKDFDQIERDNRFIKEQKIVSREIPERRR